jgi:hypothetical protein
MAKKTTKQNAPVTEKTGAWKQRYTFVKALKLEPPTTSVKGAIYLAIKSAKKGTATDITEVACSKFNLRKYTKQDPRMMTLSLLRQFAEAGAVHIQRTESTKKAKAKAKAAVAPAPVPAPKTKPKKASASKPAPAPVAVVEPPAEAAASTE